MNTRIPSTGIAVLAIAGSFALPDAPHAAEKVEWNFSTWGNPRAFTRGFEYVADYVKEKSNGNFVIVIHYGEAISPSKNNLDGIKIGSHEMANFCTSYHPGKNPVGTVLDLPFTPGTDTLEQTRQMHESFYGYEPFQKEMARWNAKPLFSGMLPQYEFMGVGEAPRTLDDWKGMRVRALGGIGDAMRKLEAVPTTVPAPETYTAMERGIVQAISFPYSYTFGAYRLHEIGRWFTEGLALGSVNCPIAMRQQAFDALPAEYQQLLIDAKPGAYDALKQAYADADKEWIPLYEQRMTKLTYTPEERAKFLKVAAEPVWNEWVEQYEKSGEIKDVEPRAVLDWVLETAKRVSGSS